MAVFVAKNYEGTVIDAVVAKSKELAMAYWHGKGVLPHSTTEINGESLRSHPTGVIPIVSTSEVDGYQLRSTNVNSSLIVVKKQ